VAALVAIAFYTVLVGSDAAVVRAAIMGGLTLFAAQIGRRQDGLNTLAAQVTTLAVIVYHLRRLSLTSLYLVDSIDLIYLQRVLGSHPD
jgi:predicted membrane metal-binding protein